MIELVTAIALLCQTGGDAHPKTVDYSQHRCQVYYLDCLKERLLKDKLEGDVALLTCIKLRKAN